MAVIKDVAKLAGVSVGTVSRYLNTPELLKEEYRERVRAAVEQLNYRPSQTARSMRTKKSYNIAYVAIEITNPFYVKLYDSVRTTCDKFGYTTTLYTTDKPDIEYVKRLLTGELGVYDGLVLGFLDFDEIHALLDGPCARSPLVVLCSRPLDKPVNTIISNHYQGGYDAAQHLIDLGHEHIAYIRYTDLDSYNPKMRGARQCIENNGLALQDNYVFSGIPRYSMGYNAAMLCMQQSPPPTAILAENDIIAIGCIKFLNDHGFLVPDDVAVIGYDDIQEAAIYTPSVSTIRQPIEEMGALAVEMLLHKIEHPQSANRQAIFDGGLVVRQSTDPAAPVVLEL